ncbi:MAG: hypothetical protein ACRYFB_12420 [Janthinobacterium lividum]
MKPEEMMERLDDTESVLKQQDKRIKDLEQKEVKLPEINIPDYSQAFEALKSQLTAALKQPDPSALEEVKTDISEVLKQLGSLGFLTQTTLTRLGRLEGMVKQLSETVTQVKHHHHFEKKSKWLLTGSIALLLLISIASGLCYGLYQQNCRLHDNDVKFRMVRQNLPIATRWIDSTFYHDPEDAERVTEKLEAQAQALAEAEAIARQKLQEAKDAKSAVRKLKKQ